MNKVFPLLIALFHSALSQAFAQGDVCEIQVIERGSGWPVPLVALKTTSNALFHTDNAGRIAFDLPEFMGVETWFSITSPGYGVKPDGFGSQGIRLTSLPGKKLTVEVERHIIAKRLGRLTGSGLFGESQQLGYEKDWKESGITGCDSVQNALHNGKLFWAWGDTDVPRYPLGLFHMTGALTSPQPLTSFEPPVRLVFAHLADAEGRPRVLCEMEGSGPTWLSGCVSLPDRTGTPRLVGTYEKIRSKLDCYRSGQAIWNEEERKFLHLSDLWHATETDKEKPSTLPEGNAVLWKDEARKEWALFGDPFPRLKCPATFEAWSDRTTWEVITPQEILTSADGEKVAPHRGAIAWNGFRKRWVAVFTQKFGKPSAFGEIWYAEAESPFGEWGTAVKILTHPHYSFYNPRLHPNFTPSDSPILLFEGTYSMTFSKTKTPTPKYDYNQILYRLDLDDPALAEAR